MNFSKTEMGAWGGFLTAFSRMNRMIEDNLQESARLTHVEFEVLLRLERVESHRMRIQDLAAESILTRSGTSRVVERLAAAGLVTREEASEDRRGAYAVLTEKGSERFQTASRAHVAFVRDHFLSHFSEQELVQMADFWDRLQGEKRGDTLPCKLP